MAWLMVVMKQIVQVHVGDAVVDECGTCGSSGIADGACDCDGNVLDCNNECGGSAIEDICGVYGGDDSSCSELH